MKTEVRMSPTLAASAPPERPPARPSRRSRRTPTPIPAAPRLTPHSFQITTAIPGWTTGTGLTTAVVTDESGAMVGIFQLASALDTPVFRAALWQALYQTADALNGAGREATKPPRLMLSSRRASSG